MFCLRKRFLLLITPLEVVLALGAVSTAAARRSSSFSGSCQVSGTVRFSPALTTTAQPGRVFATAQGPCTGTFTGPAGHPRSLNSQPVQVVAQSQGSESCASGTGTGSGYVAILGHRLRFTYSEVRTGPALVLRASGAAGGSAVAEGNVSPSANPVSVLQACGSSGLTQAPIDIRLVTRQTLSG